MNIKQRIELLRAMDTIITSLNDEAKIMTWFSIGVADGDAKCCDEDLVGYVEDDDDFKELMSLFRRLVGKSEIFCDRVLSE